MVGESREDGATPSYSEKKKNTKDIYERCVCVQERN